MYLLMKPKSSRTFHLCMSCKMATATYQNSYDQNATSREKQALGQPKTAIAEVQSGHRKRLKTKMASNWIWRKEQCHIISNQRWHKITANELSCRPTLQLCSLCCNLLLRGFHIFTLCISRICWFCRFCFFGSNFLDFTFSLSLCHQ